MGVVMNKVVEIYRAFDAENPGKFRWVVLLYVVEMTILAAVGWYVGWIGSAISAVIITAFWVFLWWNLYPTTDKARK